jgi:hypothetical protein
MRGIETRAFAIAIAKALVFDIIKSTKNTTYQLFYGIHTWDGNAVSSELK